MMAYILSLNAAAKAANVTNHVGTLLTLFTKQFVTNVGYNSYDSPALSL
jgi:hypothetical protein